MKRFILVLFTLFPFVLFGSTRILPVAAHATGHAGTQWRTSATLFNVGHDTVDVTLSFIPSGTTLPSSTLDLSLMPGESWDQPDLLGALSADGVGMVTLAGDADLFSRLGVQARTYAVGDAGTTGQALPALDPGTFYGAGTELYLAYPQDEAYRFNFGIDVVEDARVTWKLVNTAGEEIAQKSVTYSAPTHEQVNNGVGTFFGIIDPEASLLKAEVTEGKVFIYGSTVDNTTQDGTFTAAVALKHDIPPALVGIDTNTDGAADLVDADGDGVLDSPIIFNVSFPFGFYFTILSHDAEGDPVTMTLINPPNNMIVTNPSTHEIYFNPDPSQVNMQENLEVALNDGLSESIVTIPFQVVP